MKIFRADYVFPINAEPIKNGAVVTADDGKIISVAEDIPPDYAHITIEEFSGILCPGFINAHCHVELSHLKDKITDGEGLVTFIQNVQLHRNATQPEIEAAALAADEAMYKNGIVAVGDISNSNVTVALKAKSKLYYHTFVEAFGFLPQRAEEVFEKSLKLVSEFNPQPCSVTPHAPYSVSKDLFKLIKRYADNNRNLMSMHNQECEDENKFFRYKLGRFNDLYAHFGMDISFFKPQARNSLQSVLPLLSSKRDILLVHNTCTNLKDIYFLKRFDHKIHWCFCPNANIYIEGTLPKIDLFIDQGFNITLGTDSLASNYKLCILSEMATLQKHFPTLSLARLLEWGTLNGAKFLGVDNNMGSLEPGKTPGINLITGLNDLTLTSETKVRRLV
ncbi:amidohydrolase family protein [Mucilaginibacter auburnensis]|uniref:Cytosine/adenosine deaminase-related metal-dependent hydrolase n=1 Tax=Mucilaginibacter auburnensis TaxID=1457233 RepID=A0A2H9VSU6_9SPHI|nr:amidohydrolase family protein [Mucilaginibacter auburnensis]PJJ83878.1 cytosine/adenosine deaminase-related metal-dependent hydrolase [Mucilaginibacter auburnensis]